MKTAVVWALLVAGSPALAADNAPARPPAYKADPARSALQFSFRQAGASSQGVFAKFTTDLRFDAANPGASSLTVSVDVASLDTRDKERDELLRGAELFDVARYPAAVFRSTSLQRRQGGKYEARGKLTIRGITRDVRLPLDIENNRLRGATVIRRLDFGVGQGDWQSTQWVDNEVAVKFDVWLTPATVPAVGQ